MIKNKLNNNDKLTLTFVIINMALKTFDFALLSFDLIFKNFIN